MYQCNLLINVISKNDAIKKEIRAITPLERFEHTFFMDEEPQEKSLEKADLIVWEPECSAEELREELINLYARCKENVDIILCLTVDMANAFEYTEFSYISDIWIKPFSEKSICFLFGKYQKLQKEKKDNWLTQSYLDALIDGIPDLVWFKDKIGAHMKVNNAFCETVNKTKEQIAGRGHYYIWDIDPEEYSKGEFICMESEEEVMTAKRTCVFEEKVLIKDEMRLLCTYKSPLFDLDGSVMGTVGLAHDITDDRRNQEQIIKNANTDFLTQLYNRRYFYAWLGEHHHEPLTIVYMDLDYFKEINDKFGHDVGDEVLVKVAELLRKAFPQQLIARMGGDEFVIAFTREYAMGEIGEKCDAFLEALKKTYQDTPMSFLSASVGISKSDGTDKDPESLIIESDAAMYEMKKKRRCQRH